MQRLKVLITGTSSGIGREAAVYFLERGHRVTGIDILEPTISHGSYRHVIADVGKDRLPDIKGVEILVNNAGTIREGDAVRTNLIGYIRVAEKYAFNPRIRSVLNIGSISGHVGLDTPFYSASQGGRLSYTKNLAQRLGKAYKATVNSLSLGAVRTGLEPELYADKALVEAVANESILNKWMTVCEAAEFIYFLTVTNQSMTGQDVLVDNGEAAKFNFITAEGRRG